MKASLTAREVAAVIGAFHAGLLRHEQTINRLNVYPVPDGDTGTNMALTVASVIDELEAIDRSESDDPELDAICRAIGHGSLMGARGNSGVILCQILRGLADTLSRSGRVGPQELAEALAAGSATAREAVLRPVEGTILTVAACASNAATAAAKEGADVGEVAASARLAARDALFATPTQLAVLAEAGVVDAGGAGLLVFFDALCDVVSGTAPSELLELPVEVAARVAAGHLELSPVGKAEPGSAPLRYEVMYLLEAPDETLPAFKEVWAGLGDSIVVVGGDGLWNCHIHTDDIGAAVEAALDAGRPRDIRVTDLIEQVEEEEWVRSAGGSTGESAEQVPGRARETSVLAVATGEGIMRIFRSLGVSGLIAGGQSMNPSTAEILAAIEASPSEDVVILPNNTNIVPVAKTAAEIATKRVFVVPTPGVQEGFAALLDYDPDADGATNARGMEEAARRVVAGEVTQAIRESTSQVGPVAKGDWIGLSRRGIESIASELAEATCGLLDRLVDPGAEIVTLIEGAGATPAVVRHVTEWLRAHRPEVSVERHAGGQPLYAFLISIE